MTDKEMWTFKGAIAAAIIIVGLVAAVIAWRRA
jgi:hypothetical protein